MVSPSWDTYPKQYIVHFSNCQWFEMAVWRKEGAVNKQCSVLEAEELLWVLLTVGCCLGQGQYWESYDSQKGGKNASWVAVKNILFTLPSVPLSGGQWGKVQAGDFNDRVLSSSQIKATDSTAVLPEWWYLVVANRRGQGKNTKGTECSAWHSPLSCFCQVYSSLFLLTGLHYSYWSLHSLNFVVQPELTKLAYFTV